MKRIELTEADIHQIVNEAVQDILIREGFWNNLKGAFKPIGQTASQGARNVANNAGNAIRNTAQRVGQGVQNVANRVGQGVQRVGQAAQSGGQAMKAGWQNAKLQGYKQDAIEALQQYLTYAKGLVGTGDNTVQAVQNAIQALNRNSNVSTARASSFRNQFQRNLGMQPQ